MSEPTPEQKATAVSRYKAIIDLLNNGLFFGHGAALVADSIGFLSAIVNAMEPPAETLAAVPPEVPA